MRDRKKFGSSRKWLNPEHSDDTGMIQWEVEADDWSIHANFDIWDCSRKISLSFDTYAERKNPSKGHKEAVQRAKKIDILIEELQKIGYGSQKAIEHYNRGVDYQEQGQLDLALEEYSLAIELDPQYTDAYNKRGIVNFDKGKFAAKLGDPGCLYMLGCKGHYANADCPLRQWNDGLNWCVKAGSPCLACVEPDFPDNTSPLYEKISFEDIK